MNKVEKLGGVIMEVDGMERQVGMLLEAIERMKGEEEEEEEEEELEEEEEVEEEVEEAGEEEEEEEEEEEDEEAIDEGLFDDEEQVRERVEKKKKKKNNSPDEQEEEEQEDEDAKRAWEAMKGDIMKLEDGYNSAEDVGSISDSEDLGFDDAEVDELDVAVPDRLLETLSKNSKNKKAVKDHLYKRKPQFPRPVQTVTAERGASKFIVKNRGLVAHKPKINRNPRVKKREQFRKALIREGGRKRKVRDREEGEHYKGEETGVKKGITRSRILK
jgi:U3 small nucleolar RNA-associated protein 3